MSEFRGKIYDSIIDTIGATPLVRLSRLMQAENVQAEILAKLEFFNPLSSVKDRIGMAMIEDMEASGKLKAGSTLIEPTSGNTGIALAFVCAAKGYKLILCMPESMSLERRKMLYLLGAQLELTPAGLGMKGAIARANELLTEIPNSVMPQQFDNPANPAVHERTTAQEILADTNGQVDVFVAGVGTGGTITGVGRILKQKNPNVRIVAVEPTESPVLSGGNPAPHKIQGIGAGFIPSILAKDILDEIITIPSETALQTARQLAKIEAIPGGISSGANLAAAIQLAKRPEMKNKRIIAVLPSCAERYMSTPLFDNLELAS